MKLGGSLCSLVAALFAVPKGAALFGVSLGTALLLCMSAPAAEQAPSPDKDNPNSTIAVSVSAKPQTAKLGEAISLVIEVRAPGGALKLPDKLDLDPFVVLDRRGGEVNEKGLLVFELEIATFEKTGELEVPGFSLVRPATDGGTDGDGETAGDGEEVEVPPVKIKIKSMLAGVEKPEPRDVAAPVPVIVRDYRLLVLLGLLALWILSAVGLRLRRTPGGVEARHEELPPERAAHEIAIEKLDQIVEDNLLRKGRQHEYFDRVSDTVREYLGNRFGFFALDLTSRELLEELRDRPTPGLDHQLLGQLLGEADLVKFAKAQASDEISSRAIDGAYSLITNTRRDEAGGAT